ncbi:hypothetical protein BV25DRAFT_1903935 [Artomyces pyxidatus]|uniref:Uncharacterized protein n=1 Tax=Artomyces pyxidatus TaxID=48021 RepID=A0ACB8TJB3_9AGAM|nr:hypothetical protein BV25DRAFT_1903935 [Artomyces pyxidatus]
MAVDSESPPVQQLRTPSPSEGGPSEGAPAMLPADSPGPSTSSVPTPLDADPDTLQALLTAVPPKTLHSYTLAHIASAPESTLSALSAFFSTLTPPPRLHCVRCHKDYVEVENGDRSCLVPHDDESAEVERVGRARRTGAGDFAEYETLWGCCGRTVEGDGDQGPPDGWCYEGKHTTDAKRARFRADSTPTEDKLTSCLRLNCHDVRGKMPRSTRASAKRARPQAEDDEDDGSEGTEDSGIAEIAKGVSKLGKGKGKGKGKAKAKDSGLEDAAEESSVEASAESQRGR